MRVMLRIAGSCLLLSGAAISSHSQTGTYPYGSGTGATPNTTSNGRVAANPGLNHGAGNEFPVIDPNFSHRQVLARRDDLKRRMVESAARLLMLTRDLETELQSREPTDTDAKRLDEIAKLARTVRDEMRQ